MAWYKQSFGKDYLSIYSHRDEAQAIREVDFIINNLAIQHNQKILDLSCGAGRHLSVLMDRGLNFIGCDLSLDLLAEAQRKTPKWKLVQSDIAHLPFCADSFDFVLSLFTSFGYFATDEANKAVMSEAYRILRHDGGIFIDYLNSKYVIKNLVPFSERVIGDMRISERRSYDLKATRLNKFIQIVDLDGSREYNESVRVYTLDELTEMLKVTGFVVTSIFGDFDGSEYNENSKRLIIVGKVRKT